ncbi:hypothetical protein CKO27_08105 [Thiocystis violacea]|nr:hypothetical protein [Thiocystis violacea]
MAVITSVRVGFHLLGGRWVISQETPNEARHPRCLAIAIAVFGAGSAMLGSSLALPSKALPHSIQVALIPGAGSVKARS